MTILQELKDVFNVLDIPIETAMFSDVPGNKYSVITPLQDEFFYCEDLPVFVTHKVTISFFSQGNYMKQKNRIIAALLAADFYINDSRFVEREKDSGYYHYSIDVEKTYDIKEEEV